MATANATGASTGIYSYGPYGEPNTTTGPRFRYTGQQLIGELGLYHYKARFYSPGLGRFHDDLAPPIPAASAAAWLAIINPVGSVRFAGLLPT